MEFLLRYYGDVHYGQVSVDGLIGYYVGSNALKSHLQIACLVRLVSVGGVFADRRNEELRLYQKRELSLLIESDEVLSGITGRKRLADGKIDDVPTVAVLG